MENFSHSNISNISECPACQPVIEAFSRTSRCDCGWNTGDHEPRCTVEYDWQRLQDLHDAGLEEDEDEGWEPLEPEERIEFELSA